MKKTPKKKIASPPSSQKAMHDKNVKKIIRKYAKMIRRLADQ